MGRLVQLSDDDLLALQALKDTVSDLQAKARANGHEAVAQMAEAFNDLLDVVFKD